jgi:hypothetical protein
VDSPIIQSKSRRDRWSAGSLVICKRKVKAERNAHGWWAMLVSFPIVITYDRSQETQPIKLEHHNVCYGKEFIGHTASF